MALHVLTTCSCVLGGGLLLLLIEGSWVWSLPTHTQPPSRRRQLGRGFAVTKDWAFASPRCSGGSLPAVRALPSARLDVVRHATSSLLPEGALASYSARYV